MKPTIASVHRLLETAKADPVNQGWITHGYCVGDSAGKIATAINHHSHTNLDPEKITALGYLHDIGKTGGNFNFLGHILGDYALLKRQNFPAEYCNICLTHSFLTNDPNLVLSTTLFAPDELPDPTYLKTFSDIITDGDLEHFFAKFFAEHPFSLSEKIISLCDLMCLYEPLTLEKRLIDIISRHGACATTQSFINTAFALQDELEELTGCNLYDLIRQ